MPKTETETETLDIQLFRKRACNLHAKNRNRNFRYSALSKEASLNSIREKQMWNIDLKMTKHSPKKVATTLKILCEKTTLFGVEK